MSSKYHNAHAHHADNCIKVCLKQCYQSIINIGSTIYWWLYFHFRHRIVYRKVQLRVLNQNYMYQLRSLSCIYSRSIQPSTSVSVNNA